MNFKLKDDEGNDESNQLREEKKCIFVRVCEREREKDTRFEKRGSRRKRNTKREGVRVME